MTITTSNYTSNLVESVYHKILTIVSSTYTHTTLGARTITYVAGYPADIEAYQDSLPLIIIDRVNRQSPTQFEQGGKRKYTDIFYIDIIAGGFGDDTANAYMMNFLVDKIMFGFDLKWYNLTNFDTNAVEGQYNATCYEIARLTSDKASIYERHHAQIAITTWATIKID